MNHKIQRYYLHKDKLIKQMNHCKCCSTNKTLLLMNIERILWSVIIYHLHYSCFLWWQDLACWAVRHCHTCSLCPLWVNHTALTHKQEHLGPELVVSLASLPISADFLKSPRMVFMSLKSTASVRLRFCCLGSGWLLFFVLFCHGSRHADANLSLVCTRGKPKTSGLNVV